MNRVEIKTRAKKIVKEKFKDFWLGYLFIFVISFGVTFLIQLIFKDSLIGSALNMVCSLLLTTLSVGFTAYVLKMIRNEAYERNDIFKYVGEVVPIIVIYILVMLFSFLWGLLFVIPGIIAAISYSMVYYIYVDKPGKKPMEYLCLSKEMMNGYKLDFVVFVLSFIGWMLLSMITLGLALIYVIPYLTVAEAIYYDELTKKVTTK